MRWRKSSVTIKIRPYLMVNKYFIISDNLQSFWPRSRDKPSRAVAVHVAAIPAMI